MIFASKTRRAVRALLRPVAIRRIQEREFEFLDRIRLERKFIFITGMHRSGTTFLAHFIARNCDVSGFDGIPGDMDEGQFVQNVLPIESDFGGMGYFGYHPRSRMTGASALRNGEIGVSLLKDWLTYLDRNAQCYIEKTPSNFRICRLLASVFPNSSYIHVVRHPVATALALKSFSPQAIGVKGRPLSALIKHWIHCQKIALEDYGKVRDMGNPVVVTALEDLPTFGGRFADALNRKLNLGIDINAFQQAVDPEPNLKYVDVYKKILIDQPNRLPGHVIERATGMFGYSPTDLSYPPKYIRWIE